MTKGNFSHVVKVAPFFGFPNGYPMFIGPFDQPPIDTLLHFINASSEETVYFGISAAMNGNIATAMTASILLSRYL